MGMSGRRDLKMCSLSGVVVAVVGAAVVVMVMEEVVVGEEREGRSWVRCLVWKAAIVILVTEESLGVSFL